MLPRESPYRLSPFLQIQFSCRMKCNRQWTSLVMPMNLRVPHLNPSNLSPLLNLRVALRHPPPPLPKLGQQWQPPILKNGVRRMQSKRFLLRLRLAAPKEAETLQSHERNP